MHLAKVKVGKPVCIPNYFFSAISLISDIPKSGYHYSTPYHSSSEQIKVTDWTFHTVTTELITHSFFNTFSEWMLRGLRHKGQLAWFNSTVRSLKMCAIVHKGMAMEVDGLLQIHHRCEKQSGGWVKSFIFIWIW